jgi:hypothetical protein
MPIGEGIPEKLLEYCTRDLPGNIDWHIKQFLFIDNEELRNRIGKAYYSARYLYKLMEALHVEGDQLHPFIKFQIIQYAAIYEAIITHLLWNNFKKHPEVIKLQLHKAYTPVSAFGSLCKMTYDGDNVYPCIYKDKKTPKSSIPFEDKVNCAVRIGFIEEKYSRDIIDLYKQRNLSHLESEAKKKVEMTIDDAKQGYWRIQPFLEKIQEYFKENPDCIS